MSPCCLDNYGKSVLLFTHLFLADPKLEIEIQRVKGPIIPVNSNQTAIPVSPTNIQNTRKLKIKPPKNPKERYIKYFRGPEFVKKGPHPSSSASARFFFNDQTAHKCRVK